MQKHIILLGALFISSAAFSQVGINTSTPAATLDVVASATDATKIDGVIAPRLTGNQLKAKDTLYGATQTGAIVYATAAANPTTTKTVNVTAPGYYYFDGEVWQTMKGSAGATEWMTAGTTTDALGDKTGAIYRKGRVGIATDDNFAPNVALHLSRGSGSTHTGDDDINLTSIGDPSPAFYTISARGTADDPLPLVNNSRMIRFAASTQASAGAAARVFMDFTADAEHTATSSPTRMTFGTTPIGSTNSAVRMTIKNDGKVGINTTTPTELLDVRGNARIDGMIYDGINAAGVPGQVLSNDGNEVRWVNNVTVTPTVLGTLPGTSPLMENKEQHYYTGASITLPPGSWIVSTGTVARLTGSIRYDGQLWVKVYISDNATTMNPVPNNWHPDLNTSAASRTAAGALGRGMQFGMVVGDFIVRNTSGANKTYYLWSYIQTAGDDGLPTATYPNGTPYGTGTAGDARRVNQIYGNNAHERWLYATPIVQ